MQCCGGLESIFCFLSDDQSENDTASSSSPNNTKDASKKASMDRKKKDYREIPKMNLWRRRRVSPHKGTATTTTTTEEKLTRPPALAPCTDKCMFPKLSVFRLCGKRSNSNFNDNDGGAAYYYDPNEVDQSKNIQVLGQSFPTSTPNEQYRFTVGRTQGRSLEKMSSYIQWRTKFNLDDHKFTSSQSRINDDEECWNFVVSHAAEQMTPKIKLKSNLPRIARFGPRSRNGNRVVQILAAMIDPDLAPQEFYSHCVAAYLDFKLDRDSLETIVVLVDVRAGTGWTNPPAMSLLPFIKTTAKTLSTTMPERLDVCIVYPLPSPAKVIWLLIKGFLDSKHVQKIRILWGPSASPESPAPVDKMKEFFDMEAIETIEKSRLDEFC